MFKVLALLFLSSSFAMEVDVVAERISKSKDDVTSAVNYFSSEDIQNSNEISLGDFLQARTGIQMGSTGGLGQATSTFIRGGKSEYMLVIVDGVELNDPSSIGGQFEVQHLDLKSIESIELLKGPQTVLYGADALSGVLKITTSAPQKASAKVFLGGGSFATKTVGGSASGGIGRFRYSLNASLLKSDSISSSNKGEFLENDSYKKNNLNLNLSYMAKKSKSTLLVKNINSDVEIDESSKDIVDKDLSTFDQTALLFSHEYQISKKITTKINLSETKSKRSYELYSLHYKGIKQKVDLENQFQLNSNVNSFLGLEFERNKINVRGSYSGKTENLRSLYLLNFLKIGSFFSDQGIRITSGIADSSKATAKVGFGYHFSNTITLKSNYATAYKSPTLDELYSPYGGNLSLRATKGESLDIALTKKLSVGSVELTYFNTRYKDQIIYTTSYENRDRTKISGFEAEIETYFGSNYRFLGSYTHLRALDKGNGHYLARRARHLGSLGLEYLGSENKMMGLRVKYVGKRNETDGSLLKDYMLTDLYSSLDFRNSITLRLSINNIWDKNYEQVRGYNTMGRNFLLMGEYGF